MGAFSDRIRPRAAGLLCTSIAAGSYPLLIRANGLFGCFAPRPGEGCRGHVTSEVKSERMAKQPLERLAQSLKNSVLLLRFFNILILPKSAVPD